MSIAEKAVQTWADKVLKTLLQGGKEGYEIDQESLMRLYGEIMGLFSETVLWEQLPEAEPKLKGQGTVSEMFAAVGPYWHGFKMDAPSFKVAPGADGNSATAKLSFDSQYGVDKDHKEIPGTRSGKGEVNHYFIVDDAGKFCSWKQDFDVESTELVRKAIESLPK